MIRPGSEPRALSIQGGVGRWTTVLVLPSNASGQTLRVGFLYRAPNVTVRARPTYGGCARLSGVLSTQLPLTTAPSKDSNGTHLVSQRILCYGNATRRGLWMELQLGACVSRFFLSISHVRMLYTTDESSRCR